MTLGQALEQARDKMRLPASKRESLEYVVATACGWNRAGLLARLGLRCDEDLAGTVEKAARQLASGCPAEYITGRAAFCDLQVQVRPGVLVPRPETEELVVLAADVIAGRRVRDAVVLDLCSGSGAVALALASRAPSARCVGVEMDPVSLACSLASSEDTALARRVRFVRGNVLSCWDLFLRDLKGCCDLIVSNPPYVCEERLPDARDASPMEPIHALYGGRSGLVFYKRIVAQAMDWLRPGGSILLEIDDGLEERILDLFARYGLQKGRWLSDDRGLPRYAQAER